MRSSTLTAFLFSAMVACLAGRTEAAFINTTTGLTGTTQTVTFSEHTFTPGTIITNQFADRGVTFAANAYYDADQGGGPNPGYPNFAGDYVTNFPVNGSSTVNPFTINFTSVVTGAAFAMAADVTPYMFVATLNGAFVDSGTATVGVTSTQDFYGFANERFNAISIVQIGAGSGP